MTVFARHRRLLAAATAAGLALASSAPAFADVTNTATVTASSPSGAGDVTAPSNLVAVDPVDATSSLAIVKAATLQPAGDVNSDGNVDAGDTVTYTYLVVNTGTTSLNSVGIVDTHDGSGPAPAPTFQGWNIQAGSPAAIIGASTITIYPGANATFRATYTVTTQDILVAGGTGVGPTIDNDIDNSAVASGDYFNGATTTPVSSAAATAHIALDIVPALTVDKTAYEGGLPPALGGTGTIAAANRPEGTVITYVYTITNTGNVPMTTVGLADVHLGEGAFAQPAYHSVVNTSGLALNDDSIDSDPNKVDRLGPADIAYFTATYTIVLEDVEQHQ